VHFTAAHFTRDWMAQDEGVRVRLLLRLGNIYGGGQQKEPTHCSIKLNDFRHTGTQISIVSEPL
jgi:hypothetical protein